MSASYFEPYRYHGLLPRSLLGPTTNEDITYAKERVRDAESLRAKDSQGHFNPLDTYKMILDHAQELPRRKGFNYVLNISSPEHPKLVLLPHSAEVPQKHLTLQQIVEKINSENIQASPDRKRRKGWSSNNFLYKTNKA